MEFWQGRPDRLHDRFRYTMQRDGSWSIDRLPASAPDWEERLRLKLFTRGRHNDYRYVRWPHTDQSFTIAVTGFWAKDPGGPVHANVIYTSLAAAIALLGPGRISLDALLFSRRRREPS